MLCYCIALHDTLYGTVYCQYDFDNGQYGMVVVDSTNSLVYECLRVLLCLFY